MWIYLTQPFLYSYPGFEVAEIEPWEEDGEILRRLKVKFPATIASHTHEQISYFGEDGLLRRHDYAVDVLRGAEGANYCSDYRDCARRSKHGSTEVTVKEKRVAWVTGGGSGIGLAGAEALAADGSTAARLYRGR
jgi:hypothetical protein